MNLTPLAILLALAAAAFPELRTPPERPYPAVEIPRLTPTERLDDQKAWKAARPRRLARIMATLGPFPEAPSPESQTLRREELPDHTRILIRYRTESGIHTDAYLLLPKGRRGKRPGAVVLQATSASGIEDAVGMSGRESVQIALHMVRKGYVCIAPRNYLWSEPGKGYPEAAATLLARPPWRTGMAKMTWDAMRATDILAARPEVDPKRLVSIGHSLGGKEVLYHAALDPRIRAAVSCEGGIGLAFSNWDATWYLGPQIRKPGFPWNNAEVLALVAPRAFLLIGGESADGAQSWPYIRAALPVWRGYKKEERLGLLRHSAGHNFPPPGPDRDKVFAWLDRMLH